MKLSFEKHPNRTTAATILLMLIAIFGIIFFLEGCSVTRREGSTSPCSMNKHFVGYGPGGFGKSRKAL